MVEIVDTVTGIAVVGAQVYVARDDVHPAEFDAAFERLGSRIAVLANGFGNAFATDARGRAVLPLRTTDTRVDALLGHAHGFARVAGGSTHARIELKRKRCFDIEVVDTHGAPASDVRLVVLARSGIEWWNAWSGRSDAAGRASVHALEEELEPGIMKLVVGTTLARSQPEQVDLELDSLPNQPVRLVIEDGGTVEVRIVDSAAMALDFPAELRLAVDREYLDGLPLPMREAGLQCASTREGTCKFEHVGLGLRLRASAHATLASFQEPPFHGPAAAGANVRVDVAVTQAYRIVRGRLLDERRHPLAGREILGLRSDGGTHVFEATSRRDGTFDAQLGSADDFANLQSLTLRLAAGGSTSYSDVTWPPAKLASHPIEHRVFDLGDVVISDVERTPLLAAGRVIDANGAPVAEVRLEICDLSESTTSRWRSVDIHTDRDGAFAIRMATPPARFLVRGLGWAAGHTRSSDALEPGARDVVLTFVAAGSIVATVVLPPGLDSSDLDFEFTAEGPSADDVGNGSSYEYDEEGHVLARRWPGTYGFRALLFERVLAQREHLVVDSARTTDLGTIDLREQVHAVRVVVCDEHDAPLAEGSVATIAEDSRVQKDVNSDGSAVLLTLADVIDVVASAPGRCTTRFAQVASGARLALPAGLRTPLRVAPIADETLRLTLELRYVGDDELGQFTPWTRVELDATGRVDALLPLAGRYRVRAVLRAAQQRGKATLGEVESATEVVATGDGQEVEISLPAEELDTLVRRVRGR